MKRPLIGVTPSVEKSESGKTNYIKTPQYYMEAIWQAGGLPLLVDLQVLQTKDLVERLDGLLLSGGGDVSPMLFGQEQHPKTGDVSALRDQSEIALVQAFYAAKKPMLGICRGIQVLCVALGGSLHQHVPDLPGVILNHGDDHLRHGVILLPGSRLHSIYGALSIQANSTHHQAVDRIPEGFSVTALSVDGVIEGMEGARVLGVQWHPERILREGHACIFEDFIQRESIIGEGQTCVLENFIQQT